MTTYKPIIYPAYTFDASPTYHHWVKLTASDFHGLSKRPGFEGQKLLFHLNHPIQFVCITAPIVEIESPHAKFVLLTIDDGSGATVEVKITRLSKDITEGHKVELDSNTTVTNVSVEAPLGDFRVLVNGEKLQIGTIVKVKGTISEFRDNKQIELKRIMVLRSTDEEVFEWTEVARWKNDVLAKPWYLGKRKLAALKEEQELKAAEATLRQQKKAQKRMNLSSHDAARREKRRRHEEKKELKRRKAEIEMNTGALI